MICNSCRYQSPDGINFCSNCGIRFIPQAFRPYQAPQNLSGFNSSTTDAPDPSQKSIFTLGIIAFSVNFIWILIGFITSLVGYEYYMDFAIVFKIITLITSIATVFFAFVFVKNQGHKTTLLILFIVLMLFEIYQVFFRQYFGSVF